MSKRIVQALRRLATRFPDVEEGIACKGTAIESSAFKARKKTFLFLNASLARLKLRESLAEATQLASREPTLYGVGSLGWVAVKLDLDAAPPLELLERWVGESYRLIVGGRGAAPSARGGRTPARARVKS